MQIISHILTRLALTVQLWFTGVVHFVETFLSFEHPVKKRNNSFLFPKRSQLNPNLNDTAETDVKQCAMDSDNSHLVPFTNGKGEIEWTLLDQSKYQQYFPSPVSETSPSSVNSGQSNNTNNLNTASNNSNVGYNNYEIPHSNNYEASLTDESVATYLESNSISPVSSNSESEYPSFKMPEMGSDKKFQCPYCETRFKIRGYLTRHIKKHWTEKAFGCPFYHADAAHKCHATGGFSRRDTYKTHLKSRHFKYPPGTRSSSRVGQMGWCGLCGEHFQNNEIWVEMHIEEGACPKLPFEFVSKLKKGKKKTGKHSPLLDVLNKDAPNGEEHEVEHEIQEFAKVKQEDIQQFADVTQEEPMKHELYAAPTLQPRIASLKQQSPLQKEKEEEEDYESLDNENNPFLYLSAGQQQFLEFQQNHAQAQSYHAQNQYPQQHQQQQQPQAMFGYYSNNSPFIAPVDQAQFQTAPQFSPLVNQDFGIY